MLAWLIYGTLAMVTCGCLGAAWAMIGTIQPEGAISAPLRIPHPCGFRTPARSKVPSACHRFASGLVSTLLLAGAR